MKKNKYLAKVQFVDVTSKKRFEKDHEVPEDIAKRHASRVKLILVKDVEK